MPLIELFPLGRTFPVERGAALQDALFPQGVEFPCGGHGRCKGCRVKVLQGHLPVTDEDRQLLTAAAVAGGWRLACRARVQDDLKIELAQWHLSILTDDAKLPFRPREGLGIAVDLGTTTLVTQLIDLHTGDVLAVRTALNGQAQFGADIMSRIDFAMGGGQAVLERIIRDQIGGLIEQMFSEERVRRTALTEVVLVGNTVMHHLFCGIPVEPLAHFPFEPEDGGLQIFQPEELGWTWSRVGGSGPKVAPGVTARFLPCLGGFVGSDILGGVLATGLDQSHELAALLDLGTNGEIVVGHRDRMLCASTAAGPAFEGARISMGMRAATGAIVEVTCQAGEFRCRVLGNGPPRGICGSGLVDAVAGGLETGRIQATGRLTRGTTLALESPVLLQQKDIRELQLAKGAIAAGIRILLQQWGARPEDVSRIYLAGAFGNYINRASARRIGLLSFPPEKIESAGNTALRGAKVALFNLPTQEGAYAALRKRIRHVSLDADARFQDTFVEEMGFDPARDPVRE